MPGHGRLSDEADVVEYRDMLTIARDRIQDLIGKGKSLAEVKAAGLTRDYDGRYGPTTGAWTTEQFIEAMTGFSRGNFSALADKFDFSRYHTLCAMSADPAAALDSGCKKTSTDPLRIVRFAGSRAGRNQGDRARRFVRSCEDGIGRFL